MVTAIVLLNVERDKVHSIAETLADMNEVTEVYSIAGRYDLAVVVRAKADDGLEELVTNHLLKVGGITKSETLRMHSGLDILISSHHNDNFFREHIFFRYIFDLSWHYNYRLFAIWEWCKKPA